MYSGKTEPMSLQMGLPFAAEACAEKADRQSPGWTDRAETALHVAAANLPQFTCEQFRDYAARIGLEAPHDARAFGVVISRAIRRGFIKRVGVAPARSSHGSLKPVYARAAA